MTTQRAAIVLIESGKIALIRRCRSGTYYLFPGGGLEAAESARNAAAREALEELGLQVTVGKLLATVHYQGNTQEYFASVVVQGVFGTGSGSEMSLPPNSTNGTYTPVWFAAGFS